MNNHIMHFVGIHLTPSQPVWLNHYHLVRPFAYGSSTLGDDKQVMSKHVTPDLPDNPLRLRSLILLA